MKDFTLSIYRNLLEILSSRRSGFQTFNDFLNKPYLNSILLRHDVDAKKYNSLEFARIQHSKNIQGTYYFRMVPQSFDEKIIKEIAEMGHEIGYHYETMDTCNGHIDKAYDEFCRNLEILRKIVPIETICMHGSPRSPFDNKAIWEKYSYKDLGINGEPYFDTDFSKVGYLTDTGRRWNGESVSVRDKVQSPFDFNFKGTQDIIQNIHLLPDQVMFTFHPQRWTNHPIDWAQELVMQNLKNQVKKILLQRKK